MVLDKKQNLKLAETYLQNNQLLLAIEEYGKIVADVQDFNIMNLLGDLYVRAGNQSAAISCFIPVAENYSRDGFLLKAIAMYKKIHKLEPDNIEIIIKIADLYKKQKLPVEAHKLYEEALEAYKKRDNKPQIVKVLKLITELEPSNIDRKLELASVYHDIDYKMEAEELYLEVGQNLCNQNKDQEGLRLFEKVFQENPNSKLALRLLVEALTKVEEINKAIETIKGAIEKDPNSLDLLVMLGKTYLINDSVDEAEKIFIRVFTRDKTHYTYMLEMAKVFLQKKDFDRVISILVLIVDVVLQSKYKGQIINILNSILKENPNHFKSLKFLVYVYKKSQEINNLIFTLKTLLKVALEENKKLEAIETLKSLIALEPKEISYKEELKALKDAYILSLKQHNTSDLPAKTSEELEVLETSETSEGIEKLEVVEVVEVVETPGSIEEEGQPTTESTVNFSLDDWIEQVNNSSKETNNNSLVEVDLSDEIDLTGILGTKETEAKTLPNSSLPNSSLPNSSLPNSSLPNPSSFNPFNPSQFNPSQFNPSQFNPSQFNPSQFNPSQFNPSQFNPSQFNPSQFSPHNPNSVSSTKTDIRLKVELDELFYLVGKNQPLEREWRRAVRNNTEISMIAIKIDNLEKHLSNLGEAFIDSCIKKIYEAIEKTLNRGGDQLLIYRKKYIIFLMLPETAIDGAEIVAHRIKGIVSGINFSESKDKITVSQAVATARPKRGKPALTLIEKVLENLEKFSDSNQVYA